jgi:hypothetical protein
MKLLADVKDAFGTITPPSPIASFIGTDKTGSGAISQFLSNLVNLIFSVAIIVLIFMILWGAFDWIVSEGDKEKVAAAQRKITNAFIGILLFAAAFAIIAILGQVTGFKFFEGQNKTPGTSIYCPPPNCSCPTGKTCYY